MAKKYRITGIGELLWDMLPGGKQVGGAPGNFCFHAQNFGAEAAVMSAVGNDENGKEIQAVVKGRGLKLFVNYPNKPTGYVSIKLENGIPSYTIHENVAWDYISLNEEAKAWIKHTDAICFGSLAQRSDASGNTILEAIKSAPRKALKVLDVNLRQNYYSKKMLEESFALANVLKLNDEELQVMSEMFGINGSLKEKCTILLNSFNLRLIALTLGEKGSFLFSKNEQSFQEVPKVAIVDTIGAGDSFTAVMVMGLLHEKPLMQLHKEATEYAAKVCAFNGATPDIAIHR